MSENVKAIFVVIGILLLVSIPITWSVFQWIECREMEHSVFYCIGHVFR